MNANSIPGRLLASVLGCVLLLSSAVAVAGPFARARTEGQRLDGAAEVQVDDIQVYSFLQEGAGGNGRLSSDLGKYLEVVGSALRQKGIVVGVEELPAGTLVMDVAPRGPGGMVGSERIMPESGRAAASGFAQEHRFDGTPPPAGYRLLLLPDRVIHSTGLQWGTRTIRTGSGAWSSGGPQAAGVPSYSFRVYWLLEDANDQPVAAGTTTGILDVRGFPHKRMAGQMIAELERLGVVWQSPVAANRGR